MKQVVTVIASLAYFSLPTIAVAHPGHQPHAHGWLHYFSQPGHAPLAIATAAILISLAACALRKLRLRTGTAW